MGLNDTFKFSKTMLCVLCVDRVYFLFNFWKTLFDPEQIVVNGRRILLRLRLFLFSISNWGLCPSTGRPQSRTCSGRVFKQNFYLEIIPLNVLRQQYSSSNHNFFRLFIYSKISRCQKMCSKQHLILYHPINFNLFWTWIK